MVKSKQNTRLKILQTALELFSRNGYDKTSVQRIIDGVGVSKGAFYHYFKSKEEVLEAICLLHSEELMKIPWKIVKEKDGNALEKLNKIIRVAQDFKNARIEQRWKLGLALQEQQDAKFQERLLEISVERAKPWLLILIKQGIEEGVFSTEYPEEVAEWYFQLASILKKSIVKLFSQIKKNPKALEDIKRKVCFYEDLLERLLGVKQGSLEISKPLLHHIGTFIEWMKKQ